MVLRDYQFLADWIGQLHPVNQLQYLLGLTNSPRQEVQTRDLVLFQESRDVSFGIKPRINCQY